MSKKSKPTLAQALAGGRRARRKNRIKRNRLKAEIAALNAEIVELEESRKTAMLLAKIIAEQEGEIELMKRDRDEHMKIISAVRTVVRGVMNSA